LARAPSLTVLSRPGNPDLPFQVDPKEVLQKFPQHLGQVNHSQITTTKIFFSQDNKG
jgi:hypothetical protein